MKPTRENLICIIVEDESPSYKNLGFHIQNVDWLELVGNFFNAFTAMEAIQDLQPDI